MRRKISMEAAKAFYEQRNWKKDNTEVVVEERSNKVTLRLFGNLIAWYYYSGPSRESRGTLHFSMAGWNTVTTRERLSAIGITIKQKAGEPYLILENDEVLIADNVPLFVDFICAKARSENQSISMYHPAVQWPNMDSRTIG